jgi:hypothetical protein
LRCVTRIFICPASVARIERQRNPGLRHPNRRLRRRCPRLRLEQFAILANVAGPNLPQGLIRQLTPEGHSAYSPNSLQRTLFLVDRVPTTSGHASEMRRIPADYGPRNRSNLAKLEDLALIARQRIAELRALRAELTPLSPRFAGKPGNEETRCPQRRGRLPRRPGLASLRHAPRPSCACFPRVRHVAGVHGRHEPMTTNKEVKRCSRNACAHCAGPLEATFKMAMPFR